MEHIYKYTRARAAYAVVWTRLVQLAQKADDGSVIFVFEGKDDLRYYLPRIEQYFGSYPEKVIVAEGKENVLKLRGDLDEKNLKLTAAFFLDRDFDKPEDLSGQATYITPTYSIENLFARPQTIERFLIEEMHLVEHDDLVDKDNAVLRYNDWLASFTASILPHCIWLKLNADTLSALAEGERNTLKANFLTNVARMSWRDGAIHTEVAYACSYASHDISKFHGVQRTRNPRGTASFLRSVCLNVRCRPRQIFASIFESGSF